MSGCACCAELWGSGVRALAVVRAVGGAAGRECDLNPDLFSGAQKVELTQSRFSKGSAGRNRSWVGAAAGG